MKALYEWLREQVTAAGCRLYWADQAQLDQWQQAGKRLDGDWLCYVTGSGHQLDDLYNSRQTYTLTLAGLWSSTTTPEIAQTIGKKVSAVARKLHEAGNLPATVDSVTLPEDAEWSTEAGITAVLLTVAVRLQED